MVALGGAGAVSREDRIRAFLPTCDSMIGEGLITLERVEVLKYAPGPDSEPAS